MLPLVRTLHALYRNNIMLEVTVDNKRDTLIGQVRCKKDVSGVNCKVNMIIKWLLSYTIMIRRFAPFGFRRHYTLKGFSVSLRTFEKYCISYMGVLCAKTDKYVCLRESS